jgi:hypothetical protein
MRSFVVGVIGALILLASAAESRAATCSCVHPGFELMSPSSDAPAARNARVRIAFSTSWGHAVRVVLRTGAGITVPAAEVAIRAGQLTIVELRPQGLLPRDASIEVIAIEGDVATVVGRFATSSVVDRSAPTWRGHPRGTLVTSRRSHRRAALATGASCSSPRPYGVVSSRAAHDDHTSAGEILYAVWLADRRGRADTSLPPLALVPMRAGKLWLGSSSPCDRLHIRFPRRRVKLAIAAVDAAGNRSVTRVVQLGTRRH